MGYIIVLNVNSRLSYNEAIQFHKELVNAWNPKTVPKILVATGGTYNPRNILGFPHPPLSARALAPYEGGPSILRGQLLFVSF
jgi:hypothetical protein